MVQGVIIQLKGEPSRYWTVQYYRNIPIQVALNCLPDGFRGDTAVFHLHCISTRNLIFPDIAGRLQVSRNPC